MLKSKFNQIKKGVISFFMVAVMFVSMCGGSVSAATIKKPTVKSVKATSSKTIVVKWNKVKGAKGYVVYQKMGNKSFKKVATLNSGNKISYTAKNLKSDTKYSYKIKSYIVKKGKKAYSKYSNVKSVYTKHAHYFNGYVCKCGMVDDVSAYLDLKNYVLTYGEIEGSFVGFEEMDYSSSYNTLYRLRYDSNSDVIYIDVHWIDSYGNTNWTKIDLDDYYYLSSIYEGNDGYLYDDYVEGYLDPSAFTSSSPLKYTNCKNTYYTYLSLIDSARIDICNLLDWLDGYLAKNGVGISIYDLGFTAY